MVWLFDGAFPLFLWDWRCVFGFAIGYGLDCQVVVFDFPGDLRFLWGWYNIDFVTPRMVWMFWGCFG